MVGMSFWIPVVPGLDANCNQKIGCKSSSSSLLIEMDPIQTPPGWEVFPV